VSWTIVCSALWNFGSALIGGFVGGVVTAYGIGRWKGDIEQRVRALQLWQRTVDDRLERGDDRMITIPVVESKIEELNRIVELVREDVRSGFADVQHRIDRNDANVVTRAECDRQHRRTGSDD